MKTLLLALCFIAQGALGQAPAIEWQKNLGGPGPDASVSMLQTEDGGFILAGPANGIGGDVTTHYGGNDIWVTKLSSTGVLEWQKSYGGPEDDMASDIDFTADGGYVVAGYTASSSGDVTQNQGGGDAWVIKLDGSGNLDWQKSLGGSAYDAAVSVKHSASGGYVIAGVTQSTDGNVSLNHGGEDVWVVRLSATGDIVWEKTFGGSNTDSGYSVELTSDGGYIVAGQTLSTDGDITGLHTIEEVVTMGDMWVVKLDQNGNLQWQKALGGINMDIAFSVYPTADDGFAVAGQSASSDGDATINQGGFDYWVVKLSSTGALEWQKSLGGNSYDEGHSIEQTDDGGFIVAGSSSSANGDITNNKGNSDLWLVKLTASGTIEWDISLGGSNGDFGHAVHQTDDGFYAVCGYTYSSNGDVAENNGESDVWLVKLGPPTAGIEDNVKDAIAFYPNPVSSKLYFNRVSIVPGATFTITDMAGRNVLNGKLYLQNPVDVSGLPAGIYFLTSGELVHKFIKE